MSLSSRMLAAATMGWANLRIGESPVRSARALAAVRPYGLGMLGGIAYSVARTPDSVAVDDGEDQVTYAQLWRDADDLARYFRTRGIDQHCRVGLLADNSVTFVRLLLGLAKAGADTILLNTGFAGPQIVDVVADEGIQAIVCQEAYAELVTGVAASSELIVVSESDMRHALDEAEAGGSRRKVVPPRTARLVILTSGTTGRPKGANRPPGGELEGAAALLGRVPLRHGDTRLISTPIFHGWGLTNLLIGLGMSATIVLQRSFDPDEMLALVEQHRARVLVLVPIMLQRAMALPAQQMSRHNTRSLAIILSSGSAIPATTVQEALRRFGPILYNVYGSTEVSVATIATPSDLASNAYSAGRPAQGAVLRIVDDHGEPLPKGKTGRVFVSQAMQFHGYTTGGDKEKTVDGLLASGDVGRIDARGRLVIEGRADDMIVSGAENVFPREVEEVLATHPDIAEVAVVGVPDEKFGQALRACVVTFPDRELTRDDVRDFVRSRLARYKVPQDVVFLDELPRNPTGKILKTKLV